MKVIKTDNIINCCRCGSTKQLVRCTVQDECEKLKNFRSQPYERVYCGRCLNDFVNDEEKYRVIE